MNNSIISDSYLCILYKSKCPRQEIHPYIDIMRAVFLSKLRILCHIAQRRLAIIFSSYLTITNCLSAHDGQLYHFRFPCRNTLLFVFNTKTLAASARTIRQIPLCKLSPPGACFSILHPVICIFSPVTATFRGIRPVPVLPSPAAVSMTGYQNLLPYRNGRDSGRRALGLGTLRLPPVFELMAVTVHWTVTFLFQVPAPNQKSPTPEGVGLFCIPCTL